MLRRSASVSALLGALCVVAACSGTTDESVESIGDTSASASGATPTADAAASGTTPTADATAPESAPAGLATSGTPDAGVSSTKSADSALPAADTSDGEPGPNSAPGATAPAIDARSPDQVVADSGDRGQRYLAALRAAGIPSAGMDAQEVLYAQGVCRARDEGMPRPDMLREFDGVSQVYASLIPLSAGQVAEIFVSTAESSYC